MLKYTVVAVSATIPAGTVMALDEDQLRRRSLFVDVLPEDGPADRTLVRAKQALLFKHAETVMVLDDTGLNKARLQEIEPFNSKPAKAVRKAKKR